MNAEFHLDGMLTRTQAAQWLQMSERELAAKSLGLRPKVPAFRVGSQRTIRYHPRTILAKFAKDAGLPLEVVAASFGMAIKEKGNP